MADLIGKSLGCYHILEQLGEGGMAIVYKAYERRLETDVAVKVIRTETIVPSVLDRALKRFEREAKALARLDHPNIVKVTDYGEHDGKPYLVMPYLTGGTLKQRLGRPIPWQDAIQMLVPIADALDYAHSQNIVHRDVKPSNILLTEHGLPMLTDFGIAKVFDLEETQELTGTNAAMGTPEYMAPEQATAKAVDQRADIYALGVVLYEMVTGRKPFIADTPVAVLIKHATEPFPHPKQFVSNLPGGAEKILLKALAKRPEDRYQTMAEMAVSLQKLLRENGEAARREPNHSWQWALKVMLFKAASLLGIASIIGVTLLLIAMMYRETSQGSTAGGDSPIIVTDSSTLNFTPTAIPVSFTNTVEPSITPTREEILIPTALPTELVDYKGVQMALVPAGEFIMGTDNAGNSKGEERPAHIVYLDSFYIDVYEVTNNLYKSCVDAGACQPPQHSGSAKRSSYFGNSMYDDYPVVFVDWNMAATYCEWRGANLPTEAQWEKAARGTDGRLYPWGSSIDCNHANYWPAPGACKGDTTAVGSYTAGVSPYGLYDTAGNVWEWTADWYSENYYITSDARYPNPLGPSTGELRTLRGESWSFWGCYGRSTCRIGREPDSADYSIGFRCTKAVNP